MSGVYKLEISESEEELKEIDKGVKELIKESVEFSQNSPEPREEELYTDVYKQ